MVRRKRERYINTKIIFFLILGGFMAFLGALLAGQAEKTIGVTDAALGLVMSISFLMFLVAGVVWVSVAVAIKELEER